MLRHTDECRDRGYPFAADPSQQMALMAGEDIRRWSTGATYLFTNEYEKACWSRRPAGATPRCSSGSAPGSPRTGRTGIRIESPGRRRRCRSRWCRRAHVVDPTGVGDGFRAGFLGATSWGLCPERSAQVGATLATLVLEADGPQEYAVVPAEFTARLGEVYGAEAAAEVAAHLPA